MQDLFTVGRMGTGFNPIAGPVELQIAPEDEEQARDLLARFDGRDLDEHPSGSALATNDNLNKDQKTTATPFSPRAKRFFRGLLLVKLAVLFTGEGLAPGLYNGIPRESLGALQELYYSKPLLLFVHELNPFLSLISLAALLGLALF